MKNVSLHDYTPLYKAILQNKAKYDVKVLRRIKSQLYELIQQNKPTEKLYVATNLEDDQEQVDFVVGVGVYGKFGKVGYRGIKTEELFLYALGRSELQYDNVMLLKEAVPSLYRGRSHLPVCQYVATCSEKDCLNEKVRASVKGGFADFLSLGEKQRIKTNGHYKVSGTILEHYEKHGLTKTLSNIPLIAPAEIDHDDLLSFINKALDDDPVLLAVDGSGHPSRSQFKKCISIWDWLKFSPAAKTNITRLDARSEE